MEFDKELEKVALQLKKTVVIDKDTQVQADNEIACIKERFRQLCKIGDTESEDFSDIFYNFVEENYDELKVWACYNTLMLLYQGEKEEVQSDSGFDFSGWQTKGDEDVDTLKFDEELKNPTNMEAAYRQVEDVDQLDQLKQSTEEQYDHPTYLRNKWYEETRRRLEEGNKLNPHHKKLKRDVIYNRGVKVRKGDLLERKDDAFIRSVKLGQAKNGQTIRKDKSRRFIPPATSAPKEFHKPEYKNAEGTDFIKFPLKSKFSWTKKPLNYKEWTPRRGFNWLQTWAHTLSDNRHKRLKNCAIMCNGAALWLLTVTSQDHHPRVIDKYISDARVWVGDMNLRPPTPTPKTLVIREHLPKAERVIRFGIDMFTKLTVHSLEWIFKRDKPRFRQGVLWLETGEGVYARIQEDWDLVYKKYASKNLQGNFTQDVGPQILSWIKEHKIDWCASLAAYLFALFEQRSLRGVLAVTLQYALNEKNLFKHFIDSFRDIVQLQSDVEDRPFTAWEFLSTTATDLGSSMWQAILSCGLYLISENVLTDAWQKITGFSVSNFVFEVRKKCSQESVKSIADALLVGLGIFAKRISECIESKSLLPLLNQAENPNAWKLEVHAIRRFYSELICTDVPQPSSIRRLAQLRESGQIPLHYIEPITPSQMKTHIDAMVIKGKKLVDDYIGTAIHRDLKNELEHLYSLQEANSIGWGVMANRVQPFGITLVGPPGSGKTNLSKDIYNVIGRSQGYSTDPIHIYNWQMNVNFQDGLGLDHWCIMLNDIDQNVAPPVGGIDNHVTAVLKLIDNAPCPIEQSNVELKGKISSKPMLVIQTSNFPGGRLKGYSLCDNAYYRRFPYWIEVKAKEQFCTNGVLDTNKALLCNDNELYDLLVYKYSGGTGEFPYTLTTIKTRSELFKNLIKDFIEHRQRQLMMLTRNENTLFCSTCFATLRLDGSGCSCNAQLQGNFGVGSFFIASVGIFAMSKFSSFIVDRLEQYSSRIREQYDRLELAIAAVNSTFMSVEGFRTSFLSVLDYCPSTNVIMIISGFILFLRYFKHLFTQEQGRVNNAMPGWVPSGWVRAPQEYEPGVPSIIPSTYTYEDIIKQIKDNFCEVWVKDRRFCSGVGVSHNTVILPYHAVREAGDKLVIKKNTVEIPVAINEYSHFKMGRDLSMILVPGIVNTGIYKKLWNTVDKSVKQFDELVIVKPKVIISATQHCLQTVDGHYEICSDIPAEVGDCGSLYVAKMNAGWKIVGLHLSTSYLNLLAPVANAEVITQLMCDIAFTQLATTKQGIIVPDKQTCMMPELQRYDHYPAKSEVWNAVSNFGVQVFPLGTAVTKVHGSTMKTKVKPTIFAEDFKDLEEKWCGRRDYWVKPKMEGHTVDGVYTSPYTHSLTALKRGERKDEYYWLALADYIAPLDGCFREGYNSITLNEAIVGIKGSPIQSVDLKTSMGMPHNRKKINYIKIQDGQAYVDSENFLSIYEQMVELLQEGYIVCPIVLGMLKDEQVSYTKAENYKTRVFGVLPFPYNARMKQKISPVTTFMRNHPSLFESMVGINMTSRECNDVVYHLKSVSEQMRLVELDITTQDKSEDGHSLNFVALTFYAIAWSLGIEPLEPYTLIQGIRCSVYVYKNDFFFIGATNPSGNDKTVEINCIDNSLAHRYFYYRMKYPNGLPPELRKLLKHFQTSFFSQPIVGLNLRTFCTFRSHCALATYGDDSLLNVSNKAGFYDPSKIPELGLERGMIYTDGSKEPVIGWKSLEQVVFLKRSFVRLPGIDGYVARLSLKTLAKMLVLSKPSTLTNVDQSCCLATDVLRECVYWGEEFYNEMLERVNLVAGKYYILENGYLRIRTYNELFTELQSGSFSTFTEWTEEKIEIQNLCENE